ncbi:hypothetical protein [Bradyrhizobium diazoefficiens]|uniref:hypothetical protein n=1 Tax=Bradyrhizobium diazoefficiens TaxID=1355477 RepID=UPI00383643C6
MIAISTNVAIGAGSIVMFAGFMLGYAIAWRQRGRYLAHALEEAVAPDASTIIIGDLEARVRRSQA